MVALKTQNFEYNKEKYFQMEKQLKELLGSDVHIYLVWMKIERYNDFCCFVTIC